MHWCFRQSLDGNKPVVSEEISFENVDRRRTDGRTDAGRTDGRRTDGRWTTDGERSQKLILRICSGELKMKRFTENYTNECSDPDLSPILETRYHHVYLSVFSSTFFFQNLYSWLLDVMLKCKIHINLIVLLRQNDWLVMSKIKCKERSHTADKGV